jgi:hypothetical protein
MLQPRRRVHDVVIHSDRNGVLVVTHHRVMHLVHGDVMAVAMAIAVSMAIAMAIPVSMAIAVFLFSSQGIKQEPGPRPKRVQDNRLGGKGLQHLHLVLQALPSRVLYTRQRGAEPVWSREPQQP